jgi:hypothetical protein
MNLHFITFLNLYCLNGICCLVFVLLRRYQFSLFFCLLYTNIGFWAVELLKIGLLLLLLMMYNLIINFSVTTST